MITTVTARSSDLPVTLAEAKSHLRVVTEDLDSDIQAKLEAAVGYCEATTGRALRVSHTVKQTYDKWPCGGRFYFDRHPVTAIASLKYYNASGVETTVSSGSYRLQLSSEAAAYLELDDGFVWPDYDYRDDAIAIVYTAGYATIADVPAVAKQAVLLTLSLLFGDLDDRQMDSTEKARDALLNQVQWGCYR